MKNSRIIIIMSLIAGVAATALGYTAFQLARHEQEFRRNEIRGILNSECRLLAERTSSTISAVRDLLTIAAADVTPDKKGIAALRQNNPLIRETFLADSNGNLLYPATSSEFSRRYETLFVELVSANHRESEQFANVAPQAMPQQVAMSAPRKTKTVGSYRQEAANAPTAKAAAAEIDVAERKADRVTGAISAEVSESKVPASRMTSRFGLAVKSAQNGWIPWFAGNEFCPLIWAKCRNNPEKIVGSEVEMVAVESRIVPLFPQNFPRYFRFEMTDSQGKVIFASGYHPANAGQKALLTAEVIIPVSDALAPGWQVRGYIVPSLIPSGNYLFTLIIQIVSLLLVIAACGGIALWLVRREIVQAGQKTSFVANVSHELKTPLTSIRMYAEMLHDSSDRLAPEKRSKYLDVILSESERLSRLIANVLDFSRIEAGKKKYNPTAIKLAELLQETAEQWKMTLAQAGMTLELSVPVDAPEIRMDRDSLVQILQNLLSNAAKYAADGKLVRVVLFRNGDRWQLAVEDNGPGIPPSCRRKLFRKFYRCDDRLTVEKSGSGLGLAIARKLIRDQGGELEHQAAPERGARFIITLPGENS